MKHIEVHRPFHFDRNPQDVLFVRNVPSHKTYVDHWLPYYQAHKIHFNLPRFDAVYPQSEPIGEVCFWLPNVGICRLGRCVQCYALKEPYAKYGAHTRLYVALELHCVASNLSPQLQSHLKTPAFQCQYDALEGGHVQYPLVDHGDFERDVDAWFARDVDAHPVVGAMLYFERGGVIKYGRHHGGPPVWYVGLGAQELLARSIMADITSPLAEAMAVRVIEPWRY